MHFAKTWWSIPGKTSAATRAKNSRHLPPVLLRKGLFLLLFLLCASSSSLRAALQFDVFLGYDGIIPEASWFPLVCEAKNDGPTFTGTVELSSGNQGLTRRMTVELPTGTLKRFVLPVFSTTAQSYTRWD